VHKNTNKNEIGTRNNLATGTFNRKFALYIYLCVRLCVIESKQRFNAPETTQNKEECVMAPSRFSYIYRLNI